MHAACQSLISQLATLDNGFTAGLGGGQYGCWHGFAQLSRAL